MRNFKKEYTRWCEFADIDQDIVKELQDIALDDIKIEDENLIHLRG